MSIPPDAIELHPYDASWPHRYEGELARIKAALPAGSIRRAEHIGSTAIPGMLAKPIIDILLAVDSLEHARATLPSILERLGYAYWADNPNQDRLFFVKGLPPNGPRTFHVHVTTRDSVMWDRVLFRDYLRRNRKEAERYEYLKEDLAERFSSDREAYSEGKSQYHASVVRKARGESCEGPAGLVVFDETREGTEGAR
jgi:GrpB-like predicted nucleotidyltransferase (UPF0157 family)